MKKVFISALLLIVSTILFLDCASRDFTPRADPADASVDTDSSSDVQDSKKGQ